MFPQFRGTKQGYWEPPHLLLDGSVFLPKLELESDEFEDDDLSLRPSTPSGILASPPGSFVEKPSRSSRRRAIWIWFCCSCSHGGMKVSTDPCPSCGTPRCINCDTQRVYTR
ncbi:hypothetical protein FVEG_14661 [Fusarium verticillioides 7600]|uniref:Uncharacterized protein n=1 Tax=Gibberella moniliformis (strain M3125 / FGSC 7600) TaxID=334819 RepID=W7LUX0_GIBM7|nr:hypothetical protein FVEG_14661 [Fusarium verticillioides 7600]EWG36362.1 hypothetical protein FVEG_14661 [Fusarium verticillioides 7600]